MAALAAGPPNLLAGPEPHTDLEIASDCSGQLVIEGNPDLFSLTELIPLQHRPDLAEFGPGGTFEDYYVENEPGWEGLAVDEPDEGLCALPAGSDVRLVLLNEYAPYDSAVPGLTNWLLINEVGNDVELDLPAPTESVLGGPGFHVDFFHAAHSSSSVGDTYSAQYMLTDEAGLLADSDPFRLGYEVVPEPSALMMLVLGGTLLNRRRSRG
jgi:hypothetical protein